MKSIYIFLSLHFMKSKLLSFLNTMQNHKIPSAEFKSEQRRHSLSGLLSPENVSDG